MLPNFDVQGTISRIARICVGLPARYGLAEETDVQRTLALQNAFLLECGKVQGQASRGLLHPACQGPAAVPRCAITA